MSIYLDNVVLKVGNFFNCNFFYFIKHVLFQQNFTQSNNFSRIHGTGIKIREGRYRFLQLLQFNLE